MFCVLRPGRPKHFSKMSPGFLGQSRFLYKKKKATGLYWVLRCRLSCLDVR